MRILLCGFHTDLFDFGAGFWCGSLGDCICRQIQAQPNYGSGRLRIWGFRGPGIPFCVTGALWGRVTPFSSIFSKHLSTVLGWTELCHEVRNPGPQKPQIIRNENHHLALFEKFVRRPQGQRQTNQQKTSPKSSPNHPQNFLSKNPPQSPPQIPPRMFASRSSLGLKEVWVHTLMPLWRLAPNVVVFLPTIGSGWHRASRLVLKTSKSPKIVFCIRPSRWEAWVCITSHNACISTTLWGRVSFRVGPPSHLTKP